MSPSEADHLITQLESLSIVRLHVYTPKATKSIVSFDALCFHTKPASVVACAPLKASLCGLGLFAGLLDIQEFSGYERFCSLLGIRTFVIDDNEHINASVDIFVDRVGSDKLG